MIITKRLFLIVILVLILCLFVKAEELIVHLKNGGQTFFSLEKKPVITFEDKNMVVNSETASFSFLLDNVAGYDFKDVSTENHQIQSIKKAGNPVVTNGHVLFSQLETNSHVRVYSIDGKLLCNYITDSSGNVDVDLTTLKQGI